MTYKRYKYKDSPDIIQIETTIICNAKCEFCTQRKVRRKPSIMDDKIWKKIIDETRGLGITYRPFLLNEPFTDKRMVEICMYIKEDKTSSIEFNTNASLLTPDITDKLLKIGIKTMRFSIDGFFEEEYSKRRKGLDLKKVTQNAEYFCKMAKNTKTSTEVRMINFPGSDEEQKFFLEKWSKLADSTEVTALYSYPWEGQETSIKKPCLKIKKEMFFYVDGRSTLCCWDTSERAIIGDINTESALDIWNGQSVNEKRRLLDQGHRDMIELCSRCDAYKNTDFVKIQENNPENYF